MDCILPGSSVHGISQARILEWVASSFSRGSSWCRDQTWVSPIAGRFFTLWTSRDGAYPDYSILIIPAKIFLALLNWQADPSLPHQTTKEALQYSFFFFFLMFHYFIFFIPFIFISWRLITLQYCSGFCHTLTWISHGFTCVPHPDPPSHLLLYLIPLGLPSVPGLSTCLMHPAWAADLFHPR